MGVIMALCNAEASLLLALGLGFIVCYLSKKAEKELMGLGHVVGMFIIVLSSVLIFVLLILAVSPSTRNRMIAQRQMIQATMPTR